MLLPKPIQFFHVFSAPLPGNLLFRRCGHELYRNLVTPPFLLPPLRAGLPMSRWASPTTHPSGQNAESRSHQILHSLKAPMNLKTQPYKLTLVWPTWSDGEQWTSPGIVGSLHVKISEYPDSLVNIRRSWFVDENGSL